MANELIERTFQKGRLPKTLHVSTDMRFTSEQPKNIMQGIIEMYMMK